MTVDGHAVDDHDHAAPHAGNSLQGRASGDRPGGLRGVLGVLLALPFAAAAVLAGGFLWFAFHVASRETPFDGSADGIVALTGGASRIYDAVELLASGRGHRLLITGVAPTTGVAELARLVPEREHWFGCCVDLDYSAINTIGNAVETRRWALDRGFRSLVVVTSSYHMPRALLEIGHRLPGVTLIPFPVVPEHRSTEPWLSHAARAKLLVSEYLKYIIAAARIQFDLPAGPTATASRSRTKI
jgi:uncharacterized SAM-binding protein YcdF (DUF218 family)